MNASTAEYVAGLRDYADWMEQNGDRLEEIIGYLPSPTKCYVFCNTKKQLAEIVKLAGRGVKNADERWINVDREFGSSIVLQATATRENVCERVVTGTREIVKEIPDPAAPLLTVTETVEQVEWRCDPILTGAS